MVSWFSRSKAPKPSASDTERLQLPGGLWTKCIGCSEIIYTREIRRNTMVCPKCNHHFRMSAKEWISLLCDRNSDVELNGSLKANDPLSFKDSVRYKDRIRKAERKSGSNEAVVTLRARMDGRACMLGVFNFAYMGGSMGTTVGVKLCSMCEVALEENLPVIIVSASGGARMQEGIYSLMQMAKVSAALVRLGSKGLPYISVLTDPTTGGVAASFAMQGDIIVAEPGALIGFAGPRVIEQTIKKKLPEGFQRSEFLLEHGMIDMIVERREMRAKLSLLIEVLGPK